MATISKKVTKEWTKIANEGEWQSIQVIDAHPCFFSVGAEVPTANPDDVIKLEVLDATIPTSFGAGDVYAKVEGVLDYTTGKVAITEVE